MQLITTALLALGLTKSATALDLGTYYLYCGDSCTDGTLITSGTYESSTLSECAALDSPAYCNFTCDGECDPEAGDRWYLANLYSGSDCSGTVTQLQPGECAAGPFGSGYVRLNL